MNKHIIYSFLALSLIIKVQTAVAIKDSTSVDKKFFYEQGFNISQFAKQFVSFNNATLNSNLPYLLTGNFVYKNFGFRYGLNAISNNSKSNANIDGSNSTNQPSSNVTKTSSLDFREGFFYHKQVAKKLVANMGIDLLASNSKSDITTHDFSSFSQANSTTFDSKVTSTTESYGFGPFISIQYFLLRKLSIGTETSFYYFIENNVQNAKSTTIDTNSLGTNIISQTNESKGTAQRTEIKIPLTIFLYVKF